MADRRSLFSRFWPPSASRRTSTAAALPPATTTRRTPESQSSNRTSPTSSPPPPPPRAETKTPARRSTAKASSPPAPATPPRKASPEPSEWPAGELQKASQVIDSKDEPKTSSPSPPTTRSPSSSKPSSPSRLSAQSRSPPQPSSSSQEQSTLPSPTRVTPSTPKRTSKVPSPSRLTSRSPKQGPSSSPKGKKPASPSKDSTQPTEKISTSSEAPILASKGNDPKAAASQQEAEVKEEVKPDSTSIANGQIQEGTDRSAFFGHILSGTSFKHDDVEAKLSQLSELGNTAQSARGPEARETSNSMDSHAVNGSKHEPHIKLDAKPSETQDVKEVVQGKKTEVNEETKKKVDDSAAPKSVSEAQIVEKAEIPSEADQIHRKKKLEAPDVNDILATHTQVEASQSTKKIKNSSDCEKSALPKGEHARLHKNIRADVGKLTNQLAKGDNRKSISDRPVSVITLAGENRGASMHMESDSSKSERPVHIHRSYKINPNESPEATTDGEETSQAKKPEQENSMDDQLTEAYVNNNAQAINNSIVFNSSITEGSPGVHMVVNHLPKESMQSKDEKHFPETRKAEVNVSHAEKLTYQPTMRRRCLRGILMETSDSDSENPEKPRRHGCRVSC